MFRLAGLRKLRFRIKLRTLIVAIVIIGVGLGGWFEWRNRRARDMCARQESSALDWAERHERWLAFCRSQHLKGVPYDLRRNDLDIGYPSLADFKSWAEEANFHEEFAEACRQRARELAQQKQHYQRRLLIP
jgi:hypothetical protein